MSGSPVHWTVGTAADAAQDVADRVCAWAEARASAAPGTSEASGPSDLPRPGALLLPTGATPRLLYAALRARAEDGRLDTSAWHSFNLDEYWPCSADSPISFRSFMQEELFRPLGLDGDQVGFLDGSIPIEETVQVCQAYEQAMADAGGIDLAILGVGVNGHLAFNEPGTLWGCRTRLVSLEESTRSRPGFPGGLQDGPRKALSVGLGTILEAKEILLLAFGEAKGEALRQLASGAADLDWSVTCLQGHGRVRVWTDQALA